MAVGSADIHKAVTTLWTDSGLNWEFQKFWAAGDRTKFTALNDAEATPDGPWPYCVFEQEAGAVQTRMTSANDDADEGGEIQDVPFQFRVHARQVDTDARSAKGIAAALIDLIMQKFGGHPSIKPQVMELDNGSVMTVQKLNDFGVRTGDTEYEWVLSYNFKIAVPVM